MDEEDIDSDDKSKQGSTTSAAGEAVDDNAAVVTRYGRTIIKPDRLIETMAPNADLTAVELGYLGALLN